jgi:dihydropteroate synthase
MIQIYKISNGEISEYFKALDVDESGIKILEKKSVLHHLYIQGLKVGAANILKQDALSVGADLAVPRGTIIAQDPIVDAILIANERQIEALIQKEKAQPFGLKKLALQLKDFADSKKSPKKSPAKIMGVINANEDSFFQRSRFEGGEAVKKIEQMIAEGADIIDIGGVSSRPGSDSVPQEEELRRVQPVIDTVAQKKLYEKADFSIDSYSPLVVEYALKRGFSIVNDITGLADDEVAELCARYHAAVVIMHMQGSPKDMQQNPVYENIILDIDRFFAQRIEKARAFGIQKIILDVGIGFGKTLEHNIELLKHLTHFQKYGCELLIGASRKSMIEKIVPNLSVEERLPGTLAIHLHALRNGASIVRCHDVKEHFQAIRVQKELTV